MTAWKITANIHGYWVVSSNKVALEVACCNCELVFRPSAFMSPTNANYPIQQMQTALSCKYPGIQMDIPLVRSTKAAATLMGLKVLSSLLLKT